MTVKEGNLTWTRYTPPKTVSRLRSTGEERNSV